MIVLVALALARPVDGGSYAFDESDVVAFVDGPAGAARVWYSVEGPNLVLQGDADLDGVPDFAALVAEMTEAVLVTYADAGFRTIPPDEGEGGSDAMDVYLVDFGGNADGHYSTENCVGRVCGGYFVMENDFAGYGYSDIDSAVRTLTSHELFHGIQAAYDSSEASWYQEGTAVWAEQLFDPENEDFVHFCSAYLQDTGRSIDNPPAGPVPEFAYATALWWWFLTERYGDAWLVDFMESTAGTDDLLDLMEAQTDLRADWIDFATWNAATGSYSGVAESYPFAADLRDIAFEDRGASVDDDQRFYPLAANYYRVDLEGGAVVFGLGADAPDLEFHLWATDAEGRVTAPAATLPNTAGGHALGELDAGRYIFFGVNPTRAEDSTKVRVCLGPDAAECAPAADTGDTDTADTAADTGGDDTGEAPGDCGCATGSAPAGALVGFAAVCVLRRRVLPGG